MRIWRQPLLAALRLASTRQLKGCVKGSVKGFVKGLLRGLLIGCGVC